MLARLIGITIAVILGFIPKYVTAQGSTPGGGDPGARIYGEFCASCHGKYGRGDGPIAPDLKQTLPDFTDASRFVGRTDDQILKDLADSSHGPMSLGNALKKDALLSAIAHVRALSVPGQHVSIPAGRDIYIASGCAGCHGADGDGKGPIAQAITNPAPRDFTSPKFVVEGHEEELAKSISLGADQAFHGSKYMPEWATRLSPQQIRDVVAYIGTFKKKR